MIGEIKGRHGITRPIWIMPILESALGIENAFAIARASENVVALTIGLEDYTADLGVVKTAEGRESLYARTRLVNAARAAGSAGHRFRLRRRRRHGRPAALGRAFARPRIRRHGLHSSRTDSGDPRGLRARRRPRSKKR